MQTLSDIPPLFLEALSVHEAFRKLGFNSEDVFIARGLGPDRVLSILVGIKRDGQQFFLSVGHYDGTDEQLLSTWHEVVAVYKGSPEESLQNMWDNSSIKKQSVVFLNALIKKGILMPNVERDRKAGVALSNALLN